LALEETIVHIAYRFEVSSEKPQKTWDSYWSRLMTSAVPPDVTDKTSKAVELESLEQRWLEAWAVWAESKGRR